MMERAIFIALVCIGICAIVIAVLLIMVCMSLGEIEYTVRWNLTDMGRNARTTAHNTALIESRLADIWQDKAGKRPVAKCKCRKCGGERKVEK